jgi:hypothetical protein
LFQELGDASFSFVLRQVEGIRETSSTQMKRSIVASSEPTSMSGIQIKLRLRTDVEKTREPSTKNRRLKRRGSSRETCSTCILSKKTNNTSCDCIVIMKRVHGIYIISYEDIHCQIPVHR